MSVAIITGSAGLIGSEAAVAFAELGLQVVGVDNDMRREFFGAEASTAGNRRRLEDTLGNRYEHHSVDVRDSIGVDRVFSRFGRSIAVVIHAAAQPSHDWATNDPQVDFAINANGTLNLLEATRRYSPAAPFILTSTNRVYGDTPNRLPLIEHETRWEIDEGHAFWGGVQESMSLDQTSHGLYGVSKLTGDLLAQEYGRSFQMPTATFRLGCVTGPNHAGTSLHGFLSYLLRCTVTGTPYTVYGYKGKQVRDNIHSADLVNAFKHVFREPQVGQIYNFGGGRFSNCSMLEAIQLCQAVSGRELTWSYDSQNRHGDHMWWISDNGRFAGHYPDWSLTYDVPAILREMYDQNRDRWRAKG